jgi:hypothetical protein
MVVAMAADTEADTAAVTPISVAADIFVVAADILPAPTILVAEGSPGMAAEASVT